MGHQQKMSRIVQVSQLDLNQGICFVSKLELGEPRPEHWSMGVVGGNCCLWAITVLVQRLYLYLQCEICVPRLKQ